MTYYFNTFFIWKSALESLFVVVSAIKITAKYTIYSVGYARERRNNSAKKLSEIRKFVSSSHIQP